MHAADLRIAGRRPAGSRAHDPRLESRADEPSDSLRQRLGRGFFGAAQQPRPPQALLASDNPRRRGAQRSGVRPRRKQRQRTLRCVRRQERVPVACLAQGQGQLLQRPDRGRIEDVQVRIRDVGHQPGAGDAVRIERPQRARLRCRQRQRRYSGWFLSRLRPPERARPERGGHRRFPRVGPRRRSRLAVQRERARLPYVDHLSDGHLNGH